VERRAARAGATTERRKRALRAMIMEQEERRGEEWCLGR